LLGVGLLAHIYRRGSYYNLDMNDHAKRRASFLLLLPAVMGLLSGTARAADPDDESSESQWTVPAALPPTPGAPSGTPEGGYADPDRRRMDEERRKGVLDQLCRKLRLRKDFTMGSGNWPVTTLGFNRRMESDIDGGLALIDEEKLQVSWGRSLAQELGEGGPTGALWAGATVSGRSMVIRRLGSFNTCSEVDRLIDVTDIKLALPFNAERIANMAPGELWRIPLILNVGYGVSFSEAMEQTSLSFGVAKNKNGTASMTLWRLNPKQARFRFRVDYVDVRSKSLGVVTTIPAVEFASSGGNAALKFIDKELARQFRRYTSAYLSFAQAKSNGRRLVLEFMIDPTDPAQAEAMARALKGNFKTLLDLAKNMATTKTSQDETREAYERLQEENRLNLGTASYAAMSEYRSRTRNFNINIPFAVNYNRGEAYGSDKVVRYSGDGGTFEFHNAARTPNAEYFNVPFFGPIVKDLEHRNVDVVTYAPTGKPAEAPFAVYIHNQAFLRLPASSVTRGIEDANEILSLAGAARRGGVDRTMAIPVPKVAPPPEGVQEQSDQKGWVSMTMVINQKAVAEALTASAEELLKAYAAGTSLSDRTMAEWLVKNGRLEGDRLVYDQVKAARELEFRDGDSSQSWLAGMSRKAAGMVRDIGEASAAATPEDRAAKLAKAFSHENRSGMAHTEVFRVLIQFIDPLDLSGDFVAASEGGKRGAKVQAHYVLKKGRAEVARLGEAGATRGRFVDGSVLQD